MNRHVREVIDECDVIIEVVDARDVEGTRSRKLEGLVRRKGKVLLLVVNKMDLVKETKVPSGRVVLMSAKKRQGTRELRSLIHLCLPGKEKIKAGLVGYANTGKSTVINALGGKAKTSSKPGFTRGKQWLRVTKRVVLLDSPGIIPRDEDEAKLAIKGAYDVTKLKDPIGAAMKLIRTLGPQKIAKAYTAEPFDEPYEQLEELAGKWMMLRKGAELDLDRAAKRLIRDWQTGKIA
ncbi:MAG: 50S ribosome-binding GTPase [Candidatus Diapherotrites archaeon]|nr:50S ribosome-binding GTPase [Candidatus Diapherotrites archaeon]